MGDQKRLVQIVTNLLNNAAKYTPEGAPIPIRLKVEEGMLALSIEDNGIPASRLTCNRIAEAKRSWLEAKRLSQCGRQRKLVTMAVWQSKMFALDLEADLSGRYGRSGAGIIFRKRLE